MIHSALDFKHLRSPLARFLAAGLLAAGLLPLWQARLSANDYAECANDLLAAGVEAEAATAACALAYRPQALSECVTDVAAVTDIAPGAILSACSRDRRPQEVATCVTDIHNQLAVSDSAAVLNRCHRSLLPARYGTCVTGLAASADLAIDEALANCLAAGYRPANIAPTNLPEN